MRKTVFIIVTVFLCWSAVLFAQSEVRSESSTGILAGPEAQLPIGNKAENYRTGVGGRIEGLLGPSGSGPLPTWLSPTLSGGFALVPLDLGEDGLSSSANLSLLRGGLGAKAVFEANERLSFFTRAHLSGYYAALGGDTSGSASGFAWGGGGGMAFLLSSTMNLELAAAYHSYTDLYDGLAISFIVVQIMRDRQ
jgi:hypothetical protein